MNAKKKPLGISALISRQKKQATLANPINLEAEVNAGRNHSKNGKRKPELEEGNEGVNRLIVRGAEPCLTRPFLHTIALRFFQFHMPPLSRCIGCRLYLENNFEQPEIQNPNACTLNGCYTLFCRPNERVLIAAPRPFLFEGLRLRLFLTNNVSKVVFLR